MGKLTQIETLSLRDYIDKEITKLSALCIERLKNELTQKILLDIMGDNARCIALREIAYLLEYRFITEIGNTSLKHHLVKT